MISVSASIAVVIVVVDYFIWRWLGYLSSAAAVVIAAIIQQFWDFWHENPKIEKSE